jgi:hypothetical protein
MQHPIPFLGLSGQDEEWFKVFPCNELYLIVVVRGDRWYWDVTAFRLIGPGRARLLNFYCGDGDV